jgi:hypothetical protein
MYQRIVHTRFPRLGATYQCLGLLDVLVAEQELPIQIAQINRVQVDNVYLAEASEHEVLEQFAADAASSHHQYARLFPFVNTSLRARLVLPSYLFYAAMERAEAPLSKRVACHCVEDWLRPRGVENFGWC